MISFPSQTTVPPFRQRLSQRVDRTMLGVAAIAIISLLIDIGGFILPGSLEKTLHIIDVGIIVFVILSMLLHLFLAPFKLVYLRRRWPEFGLLVIFVGLLLLRAWFMDHQALSEHPSWLRTLISISITFVAKSYVAIAQIYIASHLILQGIRSSSKVAHLNLKPAQTLLLSFLLVIALGTFLLASPRSLTEPPRSIGERLLNALFTATSATCVTGLIVQDTGSYFSQFGQVVILGLIQTGGLGLMTMTAFFALVLGQGMGIRERILIGDILSTRTLGQLSHMIVSILVLTVFFELLGVLALYTVWNDPTLFTTHSSRIYYAIFHSISAFCNAGFSLFPNSLVDYRMSTAVNLIVTSLVILGGLGFTVNSNLLRYSFLGGLLRRRERLTLHTKLVLIMTPCLILSGMLLFLITEWHHALNDMGITERILTSYFQSVTTRTAGFNTVDISNLLPASYFLMMILMFIGASPGSTGGGIKTSTFAALIGSLWTTLRGKNQVEMFQRTIPEAVIHKALAIIVTSLSILSLFGFILLLTEQAPPIHIFFELLSAFGTVGLSTGLTPQLSTIGKCVIIFVMFIGRIGPLTLALAIGQRQEVGNYHYPHEQIMIG